MTQRHFFCRLCLDWLDSIVKLNDGGATEHVLPPLAALTLQRGLGSGGQPGSTSLRVGKGEGMKPRHGFIPSDRKYEGERQ